MTQRGFKMAIIAGTLGLLIIGIGWHYAAAQQSETPRVLDTQSPITYFIADGSGVPGYRASDRDLARWALQAWQRTSPKRLRFEVSTESNALVRLYWAGPEGGQYGEMRPLMVGGRRGAAVFIRPDMESLGPDIARRAAADDLLRDSIVYLTCVHELGHALGLMHTRDFRDIMYYFGYGGDVVEFFGRYRVLLHSRDDIATNSGLSAGDLERMRTMYGRE
jgi:Matrixin